MVPLSTCKAQLDSGLVRYMRNLCLNGRSQMMTIERVVAFRYNIKIVEFHYSNGYPLKTF
jgi:hypothetical protein